MCLSFNRLITFFTSAHLLLHFDFAKPRILQVDASSFALSAILSQPNKQSLLQLVCFFSQKLTPAETSWQVHDLELGAIIFALKIWRHYLYGVKFTVFTDHKSLKHIFDQKELNMRQRRWMETLCDYVRSFTTRERQT